MGKKMAAVLSGELMIALLIGMLENHDRMSGRTTRTSPPNAVRKLLPTAVATSMSRTVLQG